jgi:hypothetical protein
MEKVEGLLSPLNLSDAEWKGESHEGSQYSNMRFIGRGSQSYPNALLMLGARLGTNMTWETSCKVWIR